MTIPRYLLAPPGSPPEGLHAVLGGPDRVQEHPSVASLLEGDGAEPGWIFLPPGIPPETVIELLLRLAREPGAWSPIQLVPGDSGGWDAVPLSTAGRQGLPRVLDGIDGTMSPAGMFSYREMMRIVSDVRHDINNALTAALAETQLALLDVQPETELEAGLRTVEAQLRRVRDLVETLGAVRASSG